VERVALDVGPVGGGVQETLIEEAVMAHQYCACATVLLDRFAHRFEYALEGGFFRYRPA
jgi:hypothetical protein